MHMEQEEPTRETILRGPLLGGEALRSSQATKTTTTDCGLNDEHTKLQMIAASPQITKKRFPGRSGIGIMRRRPVLFAPPSLWAMERGLSLSLPVTNPLRLSARRTSEAMAAEGPASGTTGLETMTLDAIGFSSTSVRVGEGPGTTVPVSMWYPTDTRLSPSSIPATYDYRISITKIVKLLISQGLPVPLARDLPITRTFGGTPYNVIANAAPRSRAAPAIIFCHGYLGSRFDFLHACERLAAEGFIVAAPEFAESLSATPGFEPDAATTRPAIVRETVSLLRKELGIGSAIGLLGHSAGGGTASTMSGSFPLGRAAVAGYRSYKGEDPLLVVASGGDRVISLERVRGEILAGKIPTDTFLLPEDGALPSGAAPCHISFLSKETNDEMVTLLSPLLPLARVLDVPLLDFDVYADTRDSDDCAKLVLPTLSQFFTRNANSLGLMV
ncbi:hypothetical protein CYMTET_4818 [Cymbomonas tetramitiformis]|uniref:1-alkyl-2-acetylglycerophosphocholine esterase n=1 Tax=Cymbomonas tetramitiformis TaxID=36881 RepID=A0AAE0H0M2_9CHLO|nr:hypothetical protein CYMTET_4818 [Cymbomonas tetramitiformis]